MRSDRAVRRAVAAAVAAAVVLLVSGCSSSDGGDDPGADAATPSATADSPSPSPSPSTTASASASASQPTDDDFSVEREVALAAVSQVEGPGRFERTATCDSVVDDEPCFRDSERAEWLVGGGVLGRDVPDGQGVRETAYLAVARWKDPRAQSAWLQTYTEQNVDRYDGSFDLPVESLPGGGYSPGQRGRGTTDDVTVDGWEGSVADYESALQFQEGPPAGAQQVRSYVLRRGQVTVLFYSTALSKERLTSFDRGLPGLLALLEAGPG